jgi:hypothetical protein
VGSSPTSGILIKGINMCDCKLCQRTHKFRELIERVEDDEAKQFFEEIFDYMFQIESDLDILQCKMNGSFPLSEGQVKCLREVLKQYP